MEHILLFAGTTEGRRLADILSGYPVRLFVSVATEYGRQSAGIHENTEILCGRKDRGAIAALIREKQIRWVIDATHPFARQATENIRLACADTGREYIRCLRETLEERVPADVQPAGGKEQREAPGAMDRDRPAEDVVQVDSVAQAVGYLQDTEGNILITTGSVELQAYLALPDFYRRCYVRVLPVSGSLEKCFSLGIEGRHLLAMQGPFSKEMNIAVIRHVGASFLVTKESGRAGGYAEKLAAARETGTKLVVIRRPAEEGKSVEEIAEILRGRMSF